MTIIRSDSFSRANASGWGTASDGNTWSNKGGAGTQQIASNEGQLTGTTTSYFSALGAAIGQADAEGLVRVDVTNTTNTAGVFLRLIDTNNYYLCRTDGAGHFEFLKKVSGTSTHLGQVAFTPTASTFYWIRFRVQGTALSGKVWQDGTSEPSSWTTTATDSSLAGTSTNFVGLYGFANSTSLVNVDTFSVDNLSSVSGAGTLPGQGRLTASGVQVLSGAATLPGQGSFSAHSTTTASGAGQIAGHGAMSASGLVVITASAAPIAGHGQLSSDKITPGTGIGPVTVATRSQSWTAGSLGAGSDTETDLVYLDTSTSGVKLGLNPHYGGMPVSTVYETDSGVDSANQVSLATSNSDGHLHWETQVGTTYAASEDVAFDTAGLVEQAPTGTDFRRWYKVTGNAADANGFTWTAWVCFYPGDPTYAIFRFDLTNPSGSAKSLASEDFQGIAGLLSSTGTPAGAWNPANGFYGTVGGTPTTGWGTPNTWQTGDPDYFGVTPAAGSGLSVGMGVVRTTPWSSVGWPAGVQWASQQNTTRLKVGWRYNGAITFPASTTATLYAARVYRRNLTASDMAAIAADLLTPGTPTTTIGTFTAWRLAERAYEFAASGNVLKATLDLSPTTVTARYKPILKVTGWTDSGAPALDWGGTRLVAGTDFRATNDTANQTLYVQVYADIVTSGATSGQRNNAALTLTPASLSGAGTLPGQGRLAASGVQVVSGAASLSGHGRLAGAGAQVLSAAAALAGRGSLLAHGVQVVTRTAAALTGHGQLSGTGYAALSGGGTLAGHGRLSGTGSQGGQGQATLPGQGRLVASGYQTLSGSGAFSGRGSLAGRGLQVLTALARLVGQGRLAGSGSVAGQQIPATYTASDAPAAVYTVAASAGAVYAVGDHRG